MVAYDLVLPAVTLLALLALLGRVGAPAPAPHAHLTDPEQARMVESLDSYHIAYPTRVRRDGGHLTHDVRRTYDVTDARSQRRRRRRGAPRDATTHYRLQLGPDEAEALLDLRPNRRLLAPAFVVERRTQAGRPSRVYQPRRHCLLHGRLRDRPGSRVALSACDGLSGFIHTGRRQYLVEPVKGHRGARGQPRPHLVYRRQATVAGLVADERRSEPYRRYDAESARRSWSRSEREWSWARRAAARSRRRRSVSAERNVETLIVADPDVVQFYAGDDLETYLLTVMNGVAQLYHDASIGNAINVILVRMYIMEPIEDSSHFNISQDGDSSLKSFCSWQITMNPSSESDPHHHDVAVLLTRRNICSEKETCNTLGLAEVAGMCQPTRSCNINQDTGLSVSYTIAHELGHNFGMNHDGPGNGCDQPEGLRQHVMAPNLVNDVTPVVWSKCSRREITKFLDRDWGHCLDDQPTDQEYSYPEVPPGAMYDADHQCKLLYGPAAAHCDMGNVCETLWCSVQGRCVTKLEPAAEGTHCTVDDVTDTTDTADTTGTNTSMWCSAGECVEERSRPAAVDGRWGGWGAWGACSRPCGTAVQSSVRHCDQPVPANGGKYCVGERRRYRTCSLKDCPEETVTFRAQQCSKFDSVPYQGQNYTWSPVHDQVAPCQLSCKPAGQHFTAVLSDTVTDGTPCQLGTDHICINGRCRRIGCDGVLGSEARADRCGVCHGNGSLCRTVRDTFSSDLGDGYVVVVGIPAGARSIKMEEEASADNGSFLAVTGTSEDTDYLNANWLIEWSGEYRAGGSVLYYFRDHHNETIFIPGPLKEPLLLKVLLQNSGTRVRYEYTVPGHADAEAAQVFSWRYQAWSECTVKCGGGHQTSAAVCIEKVAGRVEDIYCTGDQPETRSRPCNTEDCPPRWWSGPWQPCSAVCGQSGRRKRQVVCVRSSGLDALHALGECDEKTRPVGEESCGTPRADCRAKWITGPWNLGRCAEDPCRLKTRSVSCPAQKRCRPDRRPHSVHTCDLVRCRLSRRGRHRPGRRRRPHSTSRDPAGQLTVLVRSGAADRGGRASELHGADADHLVTQLQRMAMTGAAAAPAGNYSWRLDHWGECDALCGDGQKSRLVLCVDQSSQASVELSRCPRPMPPNAVECSQPCLQWQVGRWSPCSVRCGDGTITRQVSCPEASRCDLHQRPIDAVPCREEPCAQWRMGDWKSCSRSCGVGYSTRSARCIDVETDRPTGGCSGRKPATKKSCNVAQCPSRQPPDKLHKCNDLIRSKRCRSTLKLCSLPYFKAKCCASCAEHLGHGSAGAP